MQKLKQYWVAILIIIILLGGLFYWYEFRPSMIISSCANEAENDAKKSLKSKVELGASQYSEASSKNMYLKDDYKYWYDKCLQRKGLNK